MIMQNSNQFLNNDARSEKEGKSTFAEVIESTLDHFTAQCWKWDHFPAFGSLVTITNESQVLIGCVTHIHTGSMDPMRYPFPYQKTEEELRNEQPQIFEFLKTTFTVQIIGHAQQKAHALSCSYFLPSVPAKIHSFVEYATMHIYSTFFQEAHYLHVLFAFSSTMPNLDELLLALLHNLAQRQLLNKKNLESFCQIFSLLTGNDYRRLKLFLSRVELLCKIHLVNF
jgi:hypothetical protein